MMNILFIDDDKDAAKYYVMALERASFKVTSAKDPDDALNKLTGPSYPNPNAIILDIMMPPGERYKKAPDVGKGLRTGILLYRDIRVTHPDTPVIVLTNSARGKDEFESIYHDSIFNNENSNVIVYEKIDLPPFELVNVARKMIKNATF